MAHFVPGLWMLNIRRTLPIPESFGSLSVFSGFIERTDGVWERQAAYVIGCHTILSLFLHSFNSWKRYLILLSFTLCLQSGLIHVMNAWYSMNVLAAFITEVLLLELQDLLFQVCGK